MSVNKLPTSVHLPSSLQQDHIRSPLRNSNMTNASPLRSRAAKLAGALLVSVHMGPSVSEDSENSVSRSQYIDICGKYTAMSIENKHMQDDLLKREETISELELRLSLTERALRQLETKHELSLLKHQEELTHYRLSLEDIQRLTQRRIEQADEDLLRLLALYRSIDENYSKLLRSYKALQSNLELEKNLKVLLIDQIEHLTKERDILLSQIDPNLTSVSDPRSQRNSVIINRTLNRHLLGNCPTEFHENNALCISCDSDVHGVTILGSPAACSPNLDYDFDGNVHGSHNLSSFVDQDDSNDFAASSPIKDSSHGSIEIPQNFHFPSSKEASSIPDLQHTSYNPSLSHSTAHKIHNQARSRRSLPTRIETLVLGSDDHFVPSPLKLARPNSTCLDGDFSLSHSIGEHKSRKRSSYTKNHHSRMNSLDLIPIKVEFELADEHPRNPLSPDRNYLNSLDSVVEGEVVDNSRDLAFMKLNGFVEPNKRDSILTSSSKRSSLLTDFNILSGDITKQEITKLKFELQSLKLHNEKLLSYIGFELQKQKKNIKKLSSKQRLRPSSVEYSDAKLIEKLKDMLIHKKRVLRLVSINPILSTKHGNLSQVFPPGNGIGLQVPSGILDEGDDFVFRSLFINSLKSDCDDYGFMNHEQRHGLRILSDLDQKYLHEEDVKRPKKYKSQTFRSDREDCDGGCVSDSDLLDEEDFLQEDDDDSQLFNCESGGRIIRCKLEDWETTSEQSSSSSSGSDVNYSQLNRLNQMKYIVMGHEYMKKQKKNRKDETLVDENLKYKFLTLVVGIVIVGFRFTSHTHLLLQSS